MADMFRRYKEKISSCEPLETTNDHPDDYEEGTPKSGLENESTISNDRPVSHAMKRASEPTIPYRRPSLRPQERVGSFGLNPARSSSILEPLQSTNTVSSFPTPIDPLGLTLVYSSENPELDLIFVHGLGGLSIRTWSWDRNPKNFWPLWLKNDPETKNSRIFTYGYDATISGKYVTNGVLDFAKDLTHRMKTYAGEGLASAAAIGEVPIIFVAHSMGGLIVKNAYIIGTADNQIAPIMERVMAMVFLATPHKGSSLAQTCNNILKTTPGYSLNSYATELERGSSTLQHINEQFRNVCAGLELVSFCEGLKTSVMPGYKKIIVSKDSAFLGYPKETSGTLQADHHGVAKFENPQDPNYQSVRGALRWLAKKALQRDTFGLQYSSWQISSYETVGERIKEVLGISESAEDDLESIKTRTMPGSCEWLLRRESFRVWVENETSSPNSLWLTGNPGSGKSTLAGFVISELRKRQIGSCHFHFFLAAHHAKRTLSYLLRSLALQLALSHEDFRAHLLNLQENTGINFGNQKATFLWEKLFEGIFFRLPASGPVFWIFDGLDEADGPSELLRLLSKLTSAAGVKILLVSRATRELTRDINDFLPAIVHDRISMDDTEADIRAYVNSSIHKIIPGDYAQNIMTDILDKASGSFLWVKLALEGIRDNWYTIGDIKKALSEIPEGMEPLYERMIESIANQPPGPRKIASRVLNWAACAFRPLNISELETALKPDFQDFYNLEQTITDVCGNFVAVNRSKVAPIHQTARQFLLQKVSNRDLGIGGSEGHEHASMVCLSFLSDSAKWKRVFTLLQEQRERLPSDTGIFRQYPFLSYSIAFWAYHVSLAPVSSDEILEAVLTFLQNHCLVWIQAIALSHNLRVLIQAARYLKTYAKRRAAKTSQGPPASFTLARDEELRMWANDLIRIVGRFGANLIESPSSIHKYVVPFCPTGSIISSSFHRVGSSHFAVSGISSTTWDDCLARLSTGEDQAAMKVLCKDNLFITLVGIDGTLIIWQAETCEEIRRITHGEYVMHATCSKTSNLIATAGYKTTKIWDITTGEMLHCLPKELHHHTTAMSFNEREDEIIVAYDDCLIQCIDMKTGQEKWSFLAHEPEVDKYYCARYMAFSPDNLQIAIVFRGRPVVVWRLPDSAKYVPIPPKRCSMLRADGTRLPDEGATWNCPEMALWHPTTNHLVILYEDTKVVDWDVAEDEQTQHSHLNAREMALSPDGNLLLTSDVHGTLSLWMVPEYRLTYRLQYEELVYSLAFSPDGTRLYDTRGTFCNVWEPDALFRPVDLDFDERSSTYETITSEPVISTDNNTRAGISALACDSTGGFYCCGKEDGTVTLYSIPEGAKVRKITSHDSSVSVIKLVWSVSRKYIVSADDSSRVIAKRLQPPAKGTNKWAVFRLFDIRVDEAVEHLLFSSTEEFLLIACPNTARVMKLKSKETLCRVEWPSTTGIVYLNHPKNPSVFLCMEATREREISWKSLSIVRREKKTLEEGREGRLTPESPVPTRTVSRAVQLGNRLLVQETVLATGNTFNGAESRHIELVDLRTLRKGGLPATASKNSRIKGLEKHVRHLIGFCQDQLVFVDHQFWLCTWAVQPVYKNHRRHFFLPKDWVNPTALELLVVTNQGTLLCPKNGVIGIVQSGFKL
ncbi:predicted protein [Uncinocarpus reesii 1704]|uniref:NACHT domain-containing protein n=1 Tax=Uncinocarpus reesii (strain UAMH 1704) TaxID=336963 RepID=C4JXB3_UNCRE|nr:uncharacterized protein UREG_06286 [Uncinocarpus reesii 1704]EEP81421.1 predicted protein [Uncinocarpus reesii 1704]